jgi:hypothetical protein
MSATRPRAGSAASRPRRWPNTSRSARSSFRHDETRHEALTGVVVEFAQYAWAVAKYRERRGDRIADAQIVRLTRAAEVTLLASASKRPEKSGPYKSLTLLLGILIFAILCGVFYAMVIKAKGGSAENDSRPVPGKRSKEGAR